MKNIIVKIVLLLLCSSISFAQESLSTFPEWSKNAVIYEANIRQFTEEGTFRAFEEHLPKLKEMGVDIIWFMPIQPVGEKNRKGTLGSYYSVKNYKMVNPEFGSIEDFKRLVKKIHDLDMYVLLDWVANHTAWDHEWTISHPEFYTKNENGEFTPPVDDWSDVIDLNYDNKLLWEFMTDALRYWIIDADIDGYRCDVAGMVPMDYWISARKEINKLKNVFMLAEADEVKLHYSGFEMTYGWPLKDIMNAAYKKKKGVEDFVAYFELESEKYPESAYRMMFTTNHDENSWNGTVYERLGDGVEMFSVLTFVVPGMPLIYSGQEAGNNKALEFFERDPIVWQEHSNRKLFTQLAKLKTENEALWNGKYGGEMNFITGAGDDILAFYREKNDQKVVAIFNLSDKENSFELNNLGQVTDYFSNEKIDVSNTFSGELKAWGYKILVK